jgi:ribosomal protein S18 acetylase RimI-like enzyme
MTKPLNIRRATLADADGILNCLQVAFAPYRTDYTAEAFSDTVLTPKTLAERLDKMSVLAALDESRQVVGTVAYSLMDSTEGHIRGMAVRPEWHGCGVAQRLLDRVQSALQELRCFAITLDTTRPLQRAISFYEKNGFRATGEVECFFGMDLLKYRKDLRGPVQKRKLVEP